MTEDQEKRWHAYVQRAKADVLGWDTLPAGLSRERKVHMPSAEELFLAEQEALARERREADALTARGRLMRVEAEGLAETWLKTRGVRLNRKGWVR